MKCAVCSHTGRRADSSCVNRLQSKSSGSLSVTMHRVLLCLTVGFQGKVSGLAGIYRVWFKGWSKEKWLSSLREVDLPQDDNAPSRDIQNLKACSLVHVGLHKPKRKINKTWFYGWLYWICNRCIGAGRCFSNHLLPADSYSSYRHMNCGWICFEQWPWAMPASLSADLLLVSEIYQIFMSWISCWAFIDGLDGTDLVSNAIHSCYCYCW